MHYLFVHSTCCLFTCTLLCITYMFGRLEPWWLSWKSQFLHCNFSATSPRILSELVQRVQDSPKPMLNHSRIWNRTTNSLCLSRSKKHKALPLYSWWKTSASLKRHLILSDFIIFSFVPLSLSLLSLWLCDKVPIYLFIFIFDSLFCCVLDTVIPQKTTVTTKKSFLSWKKADTWPINLCVYCVPLPPFLLFFFFFHLIQVTGFFWR